MRSIVLLVIACASVWAQTSTTPDCQFFESFTGNGNGTARAAQSTSTGTPCIKWRVSWQTDTATSFSAFNVNLDGAPDASGSAGTFALWSGTGVNEVGTNPGTTPTNGTYVVGPGTGAQGVYYPWVRIRISGAMGTGTISVKVLGYRGTSPAPPGSSGSNANVNIAQVGGVNVTTSDGNLGVDAGKTSRSTAAWTSATAQDTTLALTTSMMTTVGMTLNVTGGSITGGVLTFEVSDDGGTTWYAGDAYRMGTSGVDITYALSGASVQAWQVPVAGFTNFRIRLSTVISGAGTANVAVQAINGQAHIDNVTSSNTGQSIPQADGLSNTEAIPLWSVNGAATAGAIRVLPFMFNAATYDRQFICASQAVFNLSGSGATQIIALSGTTVIRICHISMSTTATEDIQIEQGTGSNCGTNNAAITGLYKSVQSMALDFTPQESLRTTTGGRAVCINQSASQALGGVVIYAQY
jgi:hypothetical protein